MRMGTLIAEGSSRWSRMATAILATGTIAAVLATIVGFGGDWHWFADLFAHFRPQYVIGFAVVLPLLLLRRCWWVAGLAGAGAVGNFAVMWPHATVPVVAQAAAADAPRVRVVSLNLLQGNTKLDAVEKFLRDSEADVIVVQEVTPASAEVLRKLAPVYPGQLIRGRKHSKGTAFLTRLPLKSVRFEGTPGQELIGAVIAEIEGSAGPFTVLGVHSHKPTSAKGAASQDLYFDWIADQVAAERAKGVPVIVAGDFNATPWSRSFKRFTAACPLTDTSRGILFGATWSFYLPHRLMIDHAFVSPEWRLLRRVVGPAVGSDHRPLILDLARLALP
jgi:endonuclease/exonuclease/phosphatase (EEP) superfamily protein YafD